MCSACAERVAHFVRDDGFALWCALRAWVRNTSHHFAPSAQYITVQDRYALAQHHLPARANIILYKTKMKKHFKRSAFFVFEAKCCACAEGDTFIIYLSKNYKNLLHIRILAVFHIALLSSLVLSQVRICWPASSFYFEAFPMNIRAKMRFLRPYWWYSAPR